MTIKINLQQNSDIFDSEKTPCQTIQVFKNVKISCKRDDLNHPIIQGNKLRKLKYNIIYALQNNIGHFATFGGAYSNHIVAAAQAAKIANINIIGFIRGEELQSTPEKWSHCLHQAHGTGMKLVFLSRQEYRLKQKSDVVKQHLSRYKNFMVIPEGGSNALALLGVAEIIDELAKQIEPPTHIITACGTGGTCAGLIDGVYKQGWNTKIIGIPVLKGAEFLVNDIENLSQNHSQVSWQLYFDYHAGGYAKLEDKYVSFGQQFSKKTKIPLEKIYNVKSFFATYDLIEKGLISAGSEVVILHTGGLQGGIV